MTSPNPGEPSTEDKVENPATHYDHPIDIVHDTTLTEEQKKQALDTLELDAKLLARADDENMGGGEQSRLIDVVEAKHELGVETLPKNPLI